MLQSFLRFIDQTQLFHPSEKILIAVSGGLDSVTLCHLFHQAGFSFSIAHCNFKLRGAESDGDEQFVKDLAGRYGVPVFVKRFDTLQYSEQHKVSIQMAARDLRYEWFRSLLISGKYDRLATAHHKNDLAETILLNLVRGTGIHGLHGIRAGTGNLIRPLLFATRRQIEAYSVTEKLSWREDSSNESTKYHRNLIRHEVIPVLKKINPSLEETFKLNSEKILAAERIFDEHVQQVREKAIRETNQYVSVDIKAIEDLIEPGIVLSELLKTYGFNYHDCLNLLKSEATGKKIESATHTAVRDREQFIIAAIVKEKTREYHIKKDQRELIAEGWKLQFSIEENKKFTIPESAGTACLDLEKLRFPLTLRKWEEGDYFYPLGMNKKKKISDFLIDRKIPLNLKENVTVLISGENIVWVTGMRIDHRFRVGIDTEKIFVIKKESL